MEPASIQEVQNFPDVLELEITQEDQDSGLPGEVYNCAVAQCVKRTYNTADVTVLNGVQKWNLLYL